VIILLLKERCRVPGNVDEGRKESESRKRKGGYPNDVQVKINEELTRTPLLGFSPDRPAGSQSGQLACSQRQTS
jgi:hypothetical protein